ncbi:DUF5994 family protein [Streptomyces longwoodensis]|uniref:DUF5994 family protein n=1 Tax=Streptomyces longwoodensis TaxID=68231 RepID=UPI00381E5E4C
MRHERIRYLSRPGLLPDAIHRAAKPGTVLWRLETTRSWEGNIDGEWWPRSRDIGAELPDLVHALTVHLRPLMRVGLDATAWDHLSTRLVIDDQVVHIASFPVGDDTVLITRGDQGHFSPLVVPPRATAEAARAATEPSTSPRPHRSSSTPAPTRHTRSRWRALGAARNATSPGITSVAPGAVGMYVPGGAFEAIGAVPPVGVDARKWCPPKFRRCR